MKVTVRSALDRISFQKMRRIAPTLLAAHRQGGELDWKPQQLPEEVAFKLTNRCNLRCSHCYQWNEQGYHHALHGAEKHGDLDLAIIEKVLLATQEIKSNVFIWGGEPLAYKAWDGLVDLLEKADRWTAICTNGMLIGQRLASLQRISNRLEMYVALDGFEVEHDALRGNGTFKKTMEGIHFLLNARKAGRYQGEVTVNCVIYDKMIGRLFDFVYFLQGQGVDAVYLSLPWYISESTATMMDNFFQEHLSSMAPASGSREASWHSYTFKIDSINADRLNLELSRIKAKDWSIKVRYNPAVSESEMREFLDGSHLPAQSKSKCLALRSRMDVYPNGNVVSCHLFPELMVGNLSTAAVDDVWHGDQFDGVRKVVAKCGLMPICAKCNLLYTRGA